MRQCLGFNRQMQRPLAPAHQTIALRLALHGPGSRMTPFLFRIHPKTGLPAPQGVFRQKNNSSIYHAPGHWVWNIADRPACRVFWPLHFSFAQRSPYGILEQPPDGAGMPVEPLAYLLEAFTGFPIGVNIGPPRQAQSPAGLGRNQTHYFIRCRLAVHFVVKAAV